MKDESYDTPIEKGSVKHTQEGLTSLSAIY